MSQKNLGLANYFSQKSKSTSDKIEEAYRLILEAGKEVRRITPKGREAKTRQMDTVKEE